MVFAWTTGFASIVGSTRVSSVDGTDGIDSVSWDASSTGTVISAGSGGGGGGAVTGSTTLKEKKLVFIRIKVNEILF